MADKTDDRSLPDDSVTLVSRSAHDRVTGSFLWALLPSSLSLDDESVVV
jgi:hypothetical protein